MPYQDKEQAKAYAKAYYETNKLKIQTRASDYFKANRAKCAENTKQYLRNNLICFYQMICVFSKNK